MTAICDQWIRKIGLILLAGENGLDLSEFRIRFQVQNADVESPNSASIRVYNLAPETVKKITQNAEFKTVSLNAGYEDGNYGTIFNGSIKQFRIGRENATDTYLDILAADGDIGYNQGIICTTIAAGATPAQLMKTCVDSMPDTGLDVGSLKTDMQHTPQPRGTVLFGMARARLRNIASSLDAGWSIQSGKVVVTDNTGYVEGEAVRINVGTGMVGIPEQTDEGIRIQCLLNSRLRIGGLVQLNNDEIIQLLQQNPNAAPVPYNQWAGLQFLAPITPDGIYRAFVVEHEGDTRGNNWYSHIIALAVDLTVQADQSVSKQ